MAKADLLHFSGMLQDTTSTFLRRPDQLIRSINVHGDTIGSIRKRLGYANYGTSSDSESVLGLHTYNDIPGGTRYLYRYVNGKVQYSTGGAWSNAKVGLDTNPKVEFEEYLNQLFMVGVDSSSNYLTTANIDGTAYSETRNVTDAPTGRDIALYKGKLYIAGTNDRLFFSSLPDSAGTTITWTSTDFERIYTNNGEVLRAVHTNKVLNELLVFKDHSMHSWDTFRVRDIDNIGTTSHRSVVTIKGITYFFNSDGIWMYSGSVPKLISRGIENWIYGIDQTKLEDVFAEKEDEKTYKLYVGNIAVGGKLYTNCEIRYSTLDNTFTIYSYFDDMQVYASHTVSGVTRVYGGDSDGDVQQLAKRADAVYSDDGNDIPIQFMFETDLGLPSERKSIDKALIYTTAAQNLSGRIRAKNGDWGTHFPINKTEEPVSVNSRDGRILQWHFSENSKNVPFMFEGLTFTTTLKTNKY